MRLRLRIQRHDLPSLAILFAIDDDSESGTPHLTIAQLLAQVSARVPLEDAGWGLEDYVVSAGGFELLHYDEVRHICRDEDELLIRPLSYVEHKTRRLGGRAQITADGRRLLDGVAFGRPLLLKRGAAAAMSRPDAVIPSPPRKRRRVIWEDGVDGGEEADEGSGALVQYAGQQEEYDDEDGEDDEDYEDVEGSYHDESEKDNEDEQRGEDDNRQALQDAEAHALEEYLAANPALRGTPLRSRSRRQTPHPRHSTSDPNVNDDLVIRNGVLIPASKSLANVKRTYMFPPSTGDSESDEEESEDDDSDEEESDEEESDEEESDEEESDEEESDEEESEDDDSEASTSDSSSDASSSDESDDERSGEEAKSSWAGLSDSSRHPPLKQKEIGLATKSAQASFTNPTKRPVQQQQNGTATTKKKASSSAITVSATAAHLSSPFQTPPQANGGGGGRGGGLPYEGMQKTKERNRRRRDAKKLNFLKSTGQLPAEATFEDLHAHLAKTGQQKSLEAFPTTDLHAHPADNGQRKSVEASPATSTSSVDLADVAREARYLHADMKALLKQQDMMEELELARQRLLASIASGGVDVTDASAAPAVKRGSSTTKGQSKNLLATDDNDEDDDDDADAAPDVESSTAPPPHKRARLDVASTQRLMFSSLGLRTPKTAAERAQLQQKLATTGAKRQQQSRSIDNQESADTGMEDKQGTADEEEEEAWRRKLDISAVECCDEGVMLSAPPFPFQQRWDPQYQRPAKKKGKRGGSSTLYSNSRNKRRRGGTDADYEEYADDGADDYAYYEESYDKYNTDGTGDALNYDDPEEEDHWEEGALLDGRRGYEDDDDDAAGPPTATTTAGNASSDAHGFPALPVDISTLPVLAAVDAQPGDVLVFTEMACDASTGWQPSMVTRTVRLLEQQQQQSKSAADPTAATGEESGNSSGGWIVQTAPRDQPQKKYDDSGRRVYEKFETIEDDDDDDNAGEDGGEEDDENLTRVMAWSEMLEPRLLLRQAATTTPAVSDA